MRGGVLQLFSPGRMVLKLPGGLWSQFLILPRLSISINLALGVLTKLTESLRCPGGWTGSGVRMLVRKRSSAQLYGSLLLIVAFHRTRYPRQHEDGLLRRGRGA